MSLSKVLKSARALRSAKNSAVCKAESFSATAVATNWFMLVLSSLLCRSTARFSERGKPQRVCHCLRHLLILPITLLGIITSIPNRAGTVPKSRTLNVTNPSARPLIAVSRTISSPGSRNCGRHRTCVFTGSAIATKASRNISTSRSLNPAASRCSASEQVASYSMASGTLTNSVILLCRAAKPRSLNSWVFLCFGHETWHFLSLRPNATASTGRSVS
jgi:hypothetical protein